VKVPEPPLLVITDRHQARLPLEEIAEAVFAAGCRWLSVRERDLSRVERLALLGRLRELAAPLGATVGVHGDLQAARAVPGVALHLPAGDAAGAARAALGAERLIGRSAHAGDPLVRADVAELNYVTLSPIFTSDSKAGYGPALGLTGLAAAVREAAVPVIALGGVRVENVRACLGTGAAGVAVMGEVMRAADPGRVVAEMIAAEVR
jgi:thiamine-phosphate pyrophosphorylase